MGYLMFIFSMNHFPNLADHLNAQFHYLIMGKMIIFTLITPYIIYRSVVPEILSIRNQAK
jgi:hypothetical protein